MSGDVGADGREDLGFEAFSPRDFARWLVSGMRAFLGFDAMAVYSPGDAFPGARLFIGRNEFDLAADLTAFYDSLPAHAQARFDEALSLIWTDFDFDRDWQLGVADEVLTLACRIRAKSIVAVLADALPKLVPPRGAMTPAAQTLRRGIFQTTLELAAPRGETIRCLHQALSMRVPAGTRPLFDEEDDAIEIVCELGTAMPALLPVWMALFARNLLNQLERDTREGGTKMLRTALEMGLGRAKLNDLFYQVQHPHGLDEEDPLERVPSRIRGDLIGLVARFNPDKMRPDLVGGLPAPDRAPPPATARDDELGDELGDSQ